MAIGIGDWVAGKYRVDALLGKGGIGSVYGATQEPLGRRVAIKTLMTESLSAEERAYRETRFFREAAICAQLKHPNTVIVFDYGELDDGELFLVMEYLEGKSLRQLEQERRRLEVPLCIQIGSQIASSLADAHDHGVIHRDLKPPNIMLVARGNNPNFVKVVDFGLVKDLSNRGGEPELTHDDAIVGSPLYMAPERFLSKEFDAPAVDIYALGIMLYEMVSGRTPFVLAPGATIHQLVLDHVEATPPPLSEVAPDVPVPTDLDALIVQCLEKVPQRRPSSMHEIYDRLAHVASQIKTAENSASLRRPTIPAVHTTASGVSSPTAVKSTSGEWRPLVVTETPTASPPPAPNASHPTATEIQATPAPSTPRWLLPAVGLGLLVIVAAGFWQVASSTRAEGGIVAPEDGPVPVAVVGPCDADREKFCGDDASEACLTRNYNALSEVCRALVPPPPKPVSVSEWLKNSRARRVWVPCALGETIVVDSASLGTLKSLDATVVDVRQDPVLGRTEFRCQAAGNTEVEGTGFFEFDVLLEAKIDVHPECPEGHPVTGRVMFDANGKALRAVMFGPTDSRATCVEAALIDHRLPAAKWARMAEYQDTP